MQNVVLNTHGLVIRVKDKVFHISAGNEYRRISPDQVQSILVTAPCMFSSAAIRLAADAGIPIYFFDRTGDARASLQSPYFGSLATLRRKQVYFSDSLEGARWVLDQFRYKTAYQIKVLKYLLDRKYAMKDDINAVISELEISVDKLKDMEQLPNADWTSSVMGWEGSQAKKYWQLLSNCLDVEWQFGTRSRRPAQDPFNALINYGYGILYNIVEQALFAAGLDPHLGILHADEYDRPTLSYDLIEPFRPWVDRLILELIFKNKIQMDYYEYIEEGFYISTNGKRFLIPAIQEWMLKRIRWEKRQLSRQSHVYRKAAELAKSISNISKRPI